MATEHDPGPTIEPDSAQTPAGQATAGQAVCRHCGAPLTVPESVANGGAQALERFVDVCSDDCRNTEGDADRLDDYTFDVWAGSHLDRISAAMEGGYVAVVPPPDVDYQRLEAHELFYRANWVHHVPEWIKKRRDSIEEDIASLAWRRPWWAWDTDNPMAKRVILFGVLPAGALAIMKSCSLI